MVCIFLFLTYFTQYDFRSRWIYLQNRNRDSYIENKHMDTKGGGKGGDKLGGCHWHIYCCYWLLVSHFSCVQLCATPSLGFSRQEHWSGLPFPSPMHKSENWKWSCSVKSDSSRPHGLQPTRLLRPWEFPGKSTGVGCHCLLQTHRHYCVKIDN